MLTGGRHVQAKSTRINVGTCFALVWCTMEEAHPMQCSPISNFVLLCQGLAQQKYHASMEQAIVSGQLASSANTINCTLKLVRREQQHKCLE